MRRRRAQNRLMGMNVMGNQSIYDATSQGQRAISDKRRRRGGRVWVAWRPPTPQ